MRVGVYVDAFNLYFGGRRTCGGSTTGWRWLDIRGLAGSVANTPNRWPGSRIDRVVYCTAFIDGSSNASGRHDQDRYIKALQATGTIDHLELGHYVYRVKKAPLATEGPRGKPALTTSAWPIMVQDSSGQDQPDARFIVSHAQREEKGSDVNVAAHLLVDILGGVVDAAIVISNDSDLRYPLQIARKHVPVGTVNPSSNQLAGDLRGESTDGVGDHWWAQLTKSDFVANQLPDPAAGVKRPTGW